MKMNRSKIIEFIFPVQATSAVVDKLGDKTPILRKYDMLAKIVLST